MALEDQNSVMVATEGYTVESTIIDGASASRSLTPDSLIGNEAGDTYLTDCSTSENIIMENSDTISAVSLESAYCSNSIPDDVASTISNTNSCPEFSRQPEPVQVFSPANQLKSQTAPSFSMNQSHKKIRRIPSGANPRHRVSTLYRPQRSQSVPQIQINPAQLQLPRRFSHSQVNQGVLPNVHAQQRSNPSANRMQQQSLPQIHQKAPQNQQTQHQQTGSAQQQQQQIIYLQIPNTGGTQSFDSQELQQQIASQLHQLVPQICTQLLHQMGPSTSNQPGKYPGAPNQTTAKSNKGDKPTNNQIHAQTDIATSMRGANPRKRKKPTNYNQTMHIVNETDSDSSLSSSQQQQSQSQSQSYSTSVEPTYPTIPQLTIPISQELLLQCQQLRDQPIYYTYQPRLETIHEESLSLKHFKVTNLSKSKILACILTILSVIVVIVLAGDRTVAVVIVTVIFVIFFFGLIGFLYLNSSRDQGFLTAKGNRNLQVNAIPCGNKSSVA